LENAYLKPSRDILAKVPPTRRHCERASFHVIEYFLVIEKQPPWKGKKFELQAKVAAKKQYVKINQSCGNQ